MSKQKTTAVNGGQKQPKKKSNRPLRIAVIAVLACAVIAAGAFGIRALVKRQGSQTPATTVPEGTTEEAEGAEMVEYEGMQLPAKYVRYLEAGEAKRAALLEDGVALTLGKTKVSQMEFQQFYFDEYKDILRSVQTSISTKGSNMTGYDNDKMPDAQTYIRGDQTWAEVFTDHAIEALQAFYAEYDMAKEAHTVMTETQIGALDTSFFRVEEYRNNHQLTEDGMAVAQFGSGMPGDLYYSRIVMGAMIASYYETRGTAIEASITAEDLEAEHQANAKLYQAVDARIYLVEDPTHIDGLYSVHNEAQFLEFAEKNYPGEKDLDAFTDCSCIRYQRVADTFAESVADWLFDPVRSEGDCTVLQDGLFQYLVLLKRKPFDSYSVNILALSRAKDAEDPEAAQKETEAFLARVQAAGGTKEAFAAELEALGESTEELTVSIENFNEYGLPQYLFARNRKVGDMAVIDQENYSVVVMVTAINTEDHDWESEVRESLVTDALEAEEAAYIEQNYTPVKRTDRVITQAVKSVNVWIVKQNEGAAQ